MNKPESYVECFGTNRKHAHTGTQCQDRTGPSVRTQCLYLYSGTATVHWRGYLKNHYVHIRTPARSALDGYRARASTAHFEFQKP